MQRIHLKAKPVYVTMRPCQNCLKKLDALGVEKVFYIYDHSNIEFNKNSRNAQNGIEVSRIVIPPINSLKNIYDKFFAMANKGFF